MLLYSSTLVFTLKPMVMEQSSSAKMPERLSEMLLKVRGTICECNDKNNYDYNQKDDNDNNSNSNCNYDINSKSKSNTGDDDDKS